MVFVVSIEEESRFSLDVGCVWLKTMLGVLIEEKIGYSCEK